MPSFRRQATTESPLKDRVREAAVEAARESQQRMLDAAREVAEQAPERAQQLRAAVAQLDVRWARSAPARWLRERFMLLVMNPILDHYAARRASGFEKLLHLKGPVILVANHASHMDTPIILSALPRKLRKRTAVAAAADYFYRYRITAYLASLLFNTVPVDRNGGGGGTKHLDKLLDDGWNLLLYPEGTRKHGNSPGRVRRGAAVLASHHNLSIVPIRVTGTAAAMPPGRVLAQASARTPVLAPPSSRGLVRRSDSAAQRHRGADRARAELLRVRGRRTLALSLSPPDHRRR